MFKNFNYICSNKTTMENQKIETLETLIRLQELIRLSKKLKDRKVEDVPKFGYSSWYYNKLLHQITIHKMVIKRLEQRFNKLLLTLK